MSESVKTAEDLAPVAPVHRTRGSGTHGPERHGGPLDGAAPAVQEPDGHHCHRHPAGRRAAHGAGPDAGPVRPELRQHRQDAGRTGRREHHGHRQRRARRLEQAPLRRPTHAALGAAVRGRGHRHRPARGPGRRILRGALRERLQLDRRHPDEPSRADRAVDHPCGLRPLGVGGNDRLRRAALPVLLPADPLRRAVGPQ